MNSGNRTIFSRSINLLFLTLLLPAGIFAAEVVAMILVFFHKGPYRFTILLDATITTGLVFPMIFILSYRPMLKHISELERAESILQARLRLMQFSIEHTIEELLQETLDELEFLTGSKIGFFHYLESDQNTIRLKAWSTNTLNSLCKAVGQDNHYSVENAGVWADSIHLRKPVIHNDYASLAHRKGLPEGHAPVTREVSVPILRDNRIVGIGGVGNKPKKFTNEDLELVSTLTDFVWDIIERKNLWSDSAIEHLQGQALLEATNRAIVR